MAMFGSMSAPVPPTPYFPTPEEQAMAIPGQATGSTPSPLGMFGSGLRQMMSQPVSVQADQGSGMMINPTPAGAGPADPQHYAPSVALGTSLPTPPIDMSGIAGAPDLSNAKAQRPGFFQHGGLGETILGRLSEAALQYQAGEGNPYATSVFKQRYDQQRFGQEALLKMQQAANQQASERNEWRWREQYKAGHPDDELTRYMTAAGIDPSSPQGQALYRQKAETMAAPPLMAVDGFDAQNNPTKTFMARPTLSSIGGAGAAGGPAIGTIRNGFRFKGGHPNDRSSWEPVGGASPNSGATFPAAMNAVVDQESGGRAGAVGPQTPYGQAQGLAQLLPGTAKAMADKLGMPWRPELMTAGSSEAAQYQRALGEAYLREGIAATGNLRDGLRYYHAGPNRKLWGPKTNNYADAVLGRLGA